jgi:hypothetical protein
MKRRNSDAEDQAGPYDRMKRQPGLKLAEGQPGQRERERERRVSDADASYNGPAKTTRTLKHAIPQRKHANNNSLSKTTRSLSQGPCQNKLVSTTGTDPKPDLMFACAP